MSICPAAASPALSLAGAPAGVAAGAGLAPAVSFVDAGLADAGIAEPGLADPGLADPGLADSGLAAAAAASSGGSALSAGAPRPVPIRGPWAAVPGTAAAGGNELRSSDGTG